MKTTNVFFLSSYRLSALAIAAASCALLGSGAQACAMHESNLTTDWSLAERAKGLRLDVRYDYAHQDQLRVGSSKVDRASMSLPAMREIEQSTKNQYVFVTGDYQFNKQWGVNVQLPYVIRRHSTIMLGEMEQTRSKSTGLGDVKVLGRYTMPIQAGTSAIDWQFGLKLPTGSFRDNFDTGPMAGTRLDRGLQVGSGTTDVLLGVNYTTALAKKWDFTARGLVQSALAQREGFKPGSSLNLTGGVRYANSAAVSTQVQLNLKVSGRDSGINADRINSGSTMLNLSPGVQVDLTPQLKAFGFVQLPIYQYVNGLQLTPRYTVSAGLSYQL